MKAINIVKQLQDYIDPRIVDVLTYPVGLELHRIFKKLNIVVYASGDKAPEDVFNRVQSSLKKVPFNHIALNEFINALPRKHANNFLYLRGKNPTTIPFKHLDSDSKYLIYITAYTIITNIMKSREGFINAGLIDQHLETVPIYVNPNPKKGVSSAFYTTPLNKGITVTNDPIKQDLFRGDKHTTNWITPIKEYVPKGVDTPKYSYAHDTLKHIRSNKSICIPDTCTVLFSPIYRKFRKVDLNPKALKVYLSFKKVTSILKDLYFFYKTDEEIPHWDSEEDIEKFLEEHSIKNMSKLDKNILMWLSDFVTDIKSLYVRKVFIDWKPSNLKMDDKGNLVLLDIIHIADEVIR